MSRRPRCACGDLYSEHDMRSQNTRVTDPCRGPVCTAMYTREHDWRDYCETYNPDADEYVPLRHILADYGLTPEEVGLRTARPWRGRLNAIFDGIALDKYEQAQE